MPYRQRLYNSYVTTAIEREVPVTPSTLEHLAVVFQKTIIGPFLPPDRSIRLLDLGCGYGSFLYACQKAGYNNCQGVDTSPEQVSLAARLGLAEKVVQADLREYLRDQTEAFDVITAFDVLEHLTKPEVLEFLDQVYLALKPGGLFIMRAPNGEGPFAGRYRYGDFTHELCFTRHSLHQIMGTVGFTQVVCQETPPVAHGFFSALRYGLWQIIRTTLWFCQAVETGDYRDRYIFTQNIVAVATK